MQMLVEPVFRAGHPLTPEQVIGGEINSADHSHIILIISKHHGTVIHHDQA